MAIQPLLSLSLSLSLTHTHTHTYIYIYVCIYTSLAGQVRFRHRETVGDINGWRYSYK
jgi:hypothetical protein